MESDLKKSEICTNLADDIDREGSDGVDEKLVFGVSLERRHL